MKARFFRDASEVPDRDGGAGREDGGLPGGLHVGWDPLQQYLIASRAGAAGVLAGLGRPGEEWFFLYPGKKIRGPTWLHWTRNAQNWNGMCAECHSTNLIKGFDPKTDSYETTWSELDVSCEACHGPGSRHVAWAEVPAMGRASSTTPAS